jgi:hypothetical protein
MRRAFAVTCMIALTGCTSTSFAPPRVNVHTFRLTGSVDNHCHVYADTDKPSAIYPNVDGAQALISNYLDSYRCAMREAANGRQPWEILSFLTLVASTTASALGAGKNVAIVGTSANSVFQAGNGYYAPREQTEILNNAVDALACIQNESVGIDPNELKSTASTQKTLLNGFVGAEGTPPSTVQVTSERQYFNMVYSALITTERAASKRLEGRGFDAAGIQAQIDALTDKIKTAQAERKDPPAPNPALYEGMLRAGAVGLDLDQAKALQTAQLDLAVLKPKLEKCALRAQGAG